MLEQYHTTGAGAVQIHARVPNKHSATTNTSPRQSREYFEAVGREAVARIKPDDIVVYGDKFVIWHPDVWNASDMKKFTRRHGVDVYDDGAKNLLFVKGRWFRQRLRLIRPTREAVIELAEDEPHLKQAEFAHDLFFNTGAAWQYADDTYERYSVKKYSARQSFRHVGKRSNKTRYVGHKDLNANVFVKYSDPDRARTKLETSFPFWLHAEWITTGTPALERIGIASFADVLTVDRRAFLRKRLVLADIDRGKLGRAFRNCAAPGRRPWHSDPVRDGGVLFRAAQTELRPEQVVESSQAVVAHFRFLPVVAKCLIPLPVDHLLPSPGSFFRATTLY